MLKNQYRKAIHVLFPEISNLFSNLYVNTVLQLLIQLPSAKDIANCNISKLTNILKSNSRGRLSRNKANLLKETAKNSIATYNRGDVFELQLIVKRILFLNTQKDDLEDEINNLMSQMSSPITSIPGIGNVIGASILGEIGNINNFDSPAKLLEFAGAEPSTYQSGKFTATNIPMVKHGSKYLRNALYQATYSAFVTKSIFYTYVNTKREQGKHFYVAMSHGMKKMCRIIFAILKTNQPFKAYNIA